MEHINQYVLGEIHMQMSQCQEGRFRQEMVLEGTRGTRIQSYDRNAHRKPAHGSWRREKSLGGGGSKKGEIHRKVHCGLESPGVLLVLSSRREVVPLDGHQRDEAADP